MLCPRFVHCKMIMLCQDRLGTRIGKAQTERAVSRSDTAGVFRRSWTKAEVEMDCNRWVGRIAMKHTDDVDFDTTPPTPSAGLWLS